MQLWHSYLILLLESVMPSLVARETAPVTMTNLASPGKTVTGIKPQGDVTVFE